MNENKINCIDCKYWNKDTLKLPDGYGICEVEGEVKLLLYSNNYRINISGKYFGCRMFEYG